MVRASIDDFQRPRVERYRRGRLSPEGYYHDSFDHAALRRHLVAPLLGGGADGAPAVFDYRLDSVVTAATTAVPANAVLIVDGVFLLRPELRKLPGHVSGLVRHRLLDGETDTWELQA